MECMYCKGTMVKGTAPFHVDRKGYHIHWDKLDAWVCTQCGEVYFEADTVTFIQRVLQMLDKETAQVAPARSSEIKPAPALVPVG